MPAFTNEILYLALIFGLLVLPRILQRALIPAPLTCFGLGMVAAVFLSAYSQDATLSLLATLGISSLFLFAGLEIDLDALRQRLSALLAHLFIRALVIVFLVYLGVRFAHMPWQVAALIALALLTPSAGFIVESLGRLGLSEQERSWVTIKAIGSELLALLALFILLQSSSIERLAWSSAVLLAMTLLLPVLFIFLGRWVMPYAPGSGFSLLVMVGLIAAFVTKELGVHYLVGAFLAGFIARRLRQRLPELASYENLHAVQLFASFFVPFYFFHRGMHVPQGAWSGEALLLGLAITVLFLPLRIGSVWLQRRIVFQESARASLNVSVALAPTLIFTLVLATILRERYAIAESWYGALLIYAGLSTLVPSLFLSRPFEIEIVGPPWPGPQKEEPTRPQ
ncbi:MAG TPA: cation:proton antiporter [Burkholderiaceae bacterium]|nr:cation:proton antiporter [Burkholderiaceae bacterium]